MNISIQVCYYTSPSTWAVLCLLTLSLPSGCIFGKITRWRRPSRGRRARRRSRRSRPRTGVRTHCCRRSVPRAGWRSWDGAWSCRRRCFDPGNHGRLSEALCCCCCSYDWRQSRENSSQHHCCVCCAVHYNSWPLLQQTVIYFEPSHAHCPANTWASHPQLKILPSVNTISSCFSNSAQQFQEII